MFFFSCNFAGYFNIIIFVVTFTVIYRGDFGSLLGFEFSLQLFYNYEQVLAHLIKILLMFIQCITNN